MRYRADIDGLRALAVLAVVFFHADVPGFEGGFVGVDVFFVISGYLITSLLLSDAGRGRISIALFYERRIRRIFPALFTVLLFALVAGWRWFMPDDLRRFGASLAATALFSSNVLFWTEAGYFDAPSESKPLLHTWSLSVEEQFYLLFPLLIGFLTKRHRRLLLPSIVLGLTASFLLSVWAVARAPGAAFYLSPSRAWELLLGAILAVWAPPAAMPRFLNEVLGFLGVALIVGSVVLLSSQTPFPGVNALYPCLGAALLIHSGRDGHTQANKLLGTRPLVFVGLISYSLYLWHWVLLVFARNLSTEPLSATKTIIVVSASLVIAIISWRLVERPFRGRGVITSRRRIFGAAIGGTLTFLVAGLAIWALDGVPGRLPESANRLALASKDTWSRHHDCEGRICELSTGRAGAHGVMIWGDSHAAVLAPLFDDRTLARPVSIAFDNGCPPLLGYRDFAEPKSGCAEFLERVLGEIEHKGIAVVILVGRWPLYVEGLRMPGEPGKPVLMTNTGRSGSNAEAFEIQLNATLGRLRSLGVQVVLMHNVPEARFNVPATLARAALHGTEPLVLGAAEITARRAGSDRILSRLAAIHDARIVDPQRILCDEQECRLQQEGQSLYSDDDHLSSFGVRQIKPLFDEMLLE